MLYDAGLDPRPQAQWLDAQFWRAQAASRDAASGRGGAQFVDTPLGACVLRHYQRGGLVARFNRDKYLWLGAARTRAFAEFRLLAALVDADLPVPSPIAAAYRREGIGYRADLLMRRIPDSEGLAVRIRSQRVDAQLAQAVGATLARFHGHGVWHADLNAHNILVDGAGKVWLIDFDRGRMRRPSLSWQRANLLRLRRSFDKLGARRMHDFDVRFWHPMLAAYHATMAQMATSIGMPR